MPLSISLTLKSLCNRMVATVLILISIASSSALLISIEKLRRGAKQSFTQTISKTDLIVGAKGGATQLLLYSVFRLGAATDNVSFETYEYFRNHPDVAWTIPYSLGDSHKGYRVVGTDENFYEHYRFRYDQQIEFAQGEKAQGLFDVVLGAEVAKLLGYKVGDKIVLSHGVGDVSFQKHEDKPFTVRGILRPTATPIDRSLYVSLEAIEAIHVDWKDGAPPLAGEEVAANTLENQKLQIHQITAFLVGAKSRLRTLSLQREVNDYREEALTAIIPGVALAELWDSISYAESALRLVSVFVVIVGLIGMMIAIYLSLEGRRREIAILRAVGVSASSVFSMTVFEAVLLSTLGAALGIVLTYVVQLILQPWMLQNFGLVIPIEAPTFIEVQLVFAIVVLGACLGCVPAWRAYSNTLQDGLAPEV